MRFLLKWSEIIAENNKGQFFKRVLNILCKVTGNGLRHSWRCQSTYQCYQFGQFFVLNYTTFVSSTVLQETHASLRSTFQPFSTRTRKTLINALSLEVSTGTFTQMTSTMISPFLVTLQRIFNTRFKKLSLVVFCCNFWTLQRKQHDFICSGCKIWYLKNVRFFGPPCI